MTAWLIVLVAGAWLLWPVPRQDPLAPGVAADPGVTADHDASSRRLGKSGTEAEPASVAGIANAMDLLALTLRGSVGLVEAIEAVGSRVGGVLGGHLLTVAAAQRWGVEDSLAWATVPGGWQPASRALRMAAVAGAPPAGLLSQAAKDLRRDETQRLEMATAKLGVRIVLPLGLAFLPAFVLTTVVPVVLALARQVLSHP